MTSPTPAHARQLVPGGPRALAIGGGHGLARTLGALRRVAGEITAVVSVADDGGSSGRLVRALRIPAPGDIRRCLVALAPAPDLLTATLEHRFAAGELEGHAFGNLLIAALAETSGDFVAAVAAAAHLVGALGTVLPAAAEPVELRARGRDGELVGQVRIMGTSGIHEVLLEPPGVAAPDAVLEAIAAAEQIVIGPGSLYTSVLAALAPAGMAKAVQASPARVVYLCNLRPQPGETAGYDAAAHVEALRRHGVEPDVVLYDPAAMPLGPMPDGVSVRAVPLARPGRLLHDEELLAEALVGAFA